MAVPQPHADPGVRLLAAKQALSQAVVSEVLAKAEEDRDWELVSEAARELVFAKENHDQFLRDRDAAEPAGT